VDLRSAGLPAREARKLLVERAWSDAAGEGIARRARALDVKRGILEIEVTERAWARELAPLLPRIASRIARGFPELGVRKFRVRMGEEVLAAPAAPPAVSGESAEAPPRRREPEEPSPAAFTEGDLLDLARRYLARAEERRRGR